MNLIEFSKKNMLVLDGAMGTMLQAGFAVKDVHRAYLKAGSNVILSNTFDDRSTENIAYAVQTAKEIAADYGAYVVLDVSPTGQLLEPLGSLKFDQAYDMFKKQILAGVAAGADAIYFETFTDLYEAKCAVLAAKENVDLPVFCTMSFEKNMRTFTGTDISSMALTLTGLGVDFIGINCSVGPAEIKKMVEELIEWTNLPIIVKPNAGLPSFESGSTVFHVEPQEFADEMAEIARLGVAGLGGCCGTTPAFIEKLAAIAQGGLRPRPKVCISPAVCSASKTVVIDRVRVVGERINPTGKKRFQTAVIESDFDYIVSQAIEQTGAGADILDVNVGLPKIDERAVMVKVVRSIQSVVDLPLQIDSSNPAAIEAGLRAYNGKAIVNSVNGEEASLKEILPIVKKYGAAVVGLTLDQNGIPKTAAARLEIARKIVQFATSYGIPLYDIYIDCLTLTSGAEQAIAYQTIDTLKMVKEHLGVKTVLGVSNVSFGLPARDKLNQNFLILAMASGLDLPIINPNDTNMMDAVYCYHQLRNIDQGSVAYIERFSQMQQVKEPLLENDLSHCIQNGLKAEAKLLAEKLLTENTPLEIVDQLLIPALDAVGKKYESGEIFLPQLLSSAEAAKSAFDILKEKIPAGENSARGKIVLATVKGDIHDIGKNIVKVVLENYGYHVIDLGKDVEITAVVEEAKRSEVKLVGLSALMTTTLENMERTIHALKQADQCITTMVGGAVLTEQIAKKIGADYYAKDAIEAVNIAKKVFEVDALV